MNCALRWRTRHWTGCPNHCEDGSKHVRWTQPVVTGLCGRLRILKLQKRQVAAWWLNLQQASMGLNRLSLGLSRVVRMQDLMFGGIKRLSSEADMCALLVQSSLLAHLTQCLRRRCELFRMVSLGTPMVGSTHAHIDGDGAKCVAVEGQAFAGVRSCGRIGWRKVLDRVDCKPLDMLALAAQQCRIIQYHLGSFCTKEHGHGLLETAIKPERNCLNKEAHYHKCLVTHLGVGAGGFEWILNLIVTHWKRKPCLLKSATDSKKK